MAEIDELVVRITGDVSGLESAVAHAQGALAGLTGAQNGNTAATERGTKATDDNAEAVKRGTKATDDYSESVKRTTKTQNENTRRTKRTASEWQSAGKQIKSVGEGIDSITKPFQIASLALGAGGVAAAKFAIDFEDSFAGVKKTVDGTPEQLAEIRQGIIDLTTTGRDGRSAIPMTTTQLNELAAAGGQLGIQTENILGFTETMAMLGTATNLSGEAGAQALARFMNVTNTSQKDVDRLGSTVVDLGNNFATTEAEIVDMALDMGATGHTIGMSTQAVLGYSTALSSMGIDAAAGGSALQRIWMDMQNAVSSGGEELDAFAKISGKSAEEFKQSWGKDADGAFRDFLKGLNESEDQVGVLTQLGFNNVRDQRALMALAGDKGFAVLTDAINRANKAWDENTALQNEFNAKAETTASKMAIAKNNVVEAGRSFGEVMLPTVVDVTGGIAKMTQGLAKMPDAGKKAIVTAGAVTVGLGALSKGAAGTIKTFGGVIEGLGKIKEVAAAGGAGAKLLSVAKGFGAVGAAAAVTVGVIAAVKAGMEAYHEAQIHWADDLVEPTQRLSESTQKVRELGEAQKELSKLRVVINSGDSSAEEVEAAKQRVHEIAEMLKEKYNLDITVNDDDLDGTIDKLDEVAKKQQEMNLNDARENASSLRAGLSSDVSVYEENPKEIAKTSRELALAKDARDNLNDAYSDAKAKMDAYQDTLNNYHEQTGKSMELDDMDRFMQEQDKLIKDLNGIKDKYGLTDYGEVTDALKFISALNRDLDELGDEKTENSKIKNLTDDLNGLKDAQDTFEESRSQLKSAGLTELEFGDAAKGMKLLTYATNDFHEPALTTALDVAKIQSGLDSFTELQGKSGAEINKAVSDYQGAAQQFGATSEEISRGSALIKNGLDSASQVTPDNLNNVLADFDTYAKNFGLNSQEIALGTSLIQKGFDSVQDAIDAGQVESLFEALSGNGKAMGLDASAIAEFAQSLNLIPDNKHIEISTEGDLSLVDNVTEKLAEINGQSYKVSVDAEGNVEILDTATGKVETLQGLGAVSIGVDAEGNTVALDEAGNKVATLKGYGNVSIAVDAQGNVTVLSDAEQKINELKQNGAVTVRVNDETGNLEGLDKANQVIGEIKQNGEVDIKVKANTDGVDKESLFDKIFGVKGASAAEIETTADVKVNPGNVDTSATDTAVQDSASKTPAEINQTADVKVTPGDIDVSGVQTAVQESAAQPSAPVTQTADVTVTPGNVDASGVQTAVQDAVSSATTAAEASAAVTITGTVNFEQGTTPTTVPDATGKANFTLGSHPDSAPDISGTANYTGVFPTEAPTITGVVNYVLGSVAKPNATGTDYFSGGLAMVNDQRGIADPRELIIDRGRAFIPEGRDVILPLSKGAKVYTARQTKAIMSSLGIPRYAEGKENSDAFTTARDNWSHYTKTHAVTTTQELQKWLELQKEFRENQKDIEDIEEQIFSLRQKQTKELNEQSEKYIELHAALNDWADIGDDPVSAFNRVRERNMAEVEAGRQTWEDYADTVSRLGKDMYDDRISQSRDWLDHEEKYHDLSADEYIDGLKRMAAYTEEYFTNGLISYREYAEGLAEINDSIIDKAREKLDKQMDESLAWTDDRTYFNDWQNYGDDPISAYNRVKEREYTDMEAGIQSWEDYVEHMSEYGSALYQGRKDQSERWLKEQRDYFGMEAEDYAAGLERMKKTADEYLAAGIIDVREWHEAVTDINHQMWDEAADAYDDALKKQSEYISDLRDRFSKEEQELRDSWDVDDRADDIDDVRRQLDIYRGAVTDRGQQKYKDLQEQMKQLQRDEELYQLQTRNNAVLEDLEAEYERAEDAKADVLKQVVTTNVDISDFVGRMNDTISNSGQNIENLLSRILDALPLNGGETSYYDNHSQITINHADTTDVMARLRWKVGY